MNQLAPRSASAGRFAKPVPEDERELTRLAGQGDLDAFGQLVDRYAEQARRVARAVLNDHHDGDDAAQDAFLSALRNLHRYDPSRPFGPWLMRIVSNAAVDRLRRKKVRASEPISPRAASRHDNPAIDTDRRAFLEAVEAGLAQLPERQRRAVVFFDVEGYSHAEIASIMDVPQGTVRSDVFHGPRALRRALAAWHDWKEERR